MTYEERTNLESYLRNIHKNDDKSIRKDTSLLEIDCEIIRLYKKRGQKCPLPLFYLVYMYKQ